MPTPRFELYEIPGVEVFAAGDYGAGNVVTSADLKQIVRNYYRLRGLHSPPVGLGHNEDQARLPLLLDSPARPWMIGPTGDNRSDLPAAGYCRNLRYVPDNYGGTIVADFCEVPDPIARLIESRSYKQVSSEIYTFRDGMGGVYPNTLRRVSLQGFTTPVVKRLSDLPLPVKSKQYAEQFVTPRTVLRPIKNPVHAGYGVTYFAEVSQVNKKSMLDAVRGAGLNLSDSAVAAMTEGDVKALYTSVCTRKYAEGDGGGNAPPAAANNGQGDTSREEMIEALAKLGEDAAQLSQLSDADLKALYMKRMAETATGNTGPVAGGGSNPDTVKAYAEVARLHAEVKKYAEEAAKERKRNAVENQINRLVNEGRVTPAERDGLALQLMEADASEVKKFAEGGKQYAETSYQAMIRRLNSRRPVVQFGERQTQQIPTSVSDQAAAVEAEAEKVRQYAETHEKAVRAFGKTPDTYVTEFKQLAAKGIVTSAAQFTGEGK